MTSDRQAGLRWGILGAGKIAAVFAADARAAGIELAAVGARDVRRGQAFADRFGVPRVFGSYEQLCASPEVDVIYIATPQAFHEEQALLTIAHGKHVLVEKAFTVDAASARRVFAAARAAGVFVLEAMWTRFTPTMTAVRERIARGDLGEVLSVRTAHHQKLDLSPTGRHGDPRLAGGALLDLGVYGYALAVDLLGMPSEVIARGRVNADGVDLGVTTVFEYGDAGSGGAQASMQVSMDHPGANDASIMGTSGWIHLDAPYFTWTSFQRHDAARPTRLVESWTPYASSGMEGTRGMQFQAFELERCVAEGLSESPRMPHAHTLAVLDAMDEARAQLG